MPTPERRSINELPTNLWQRRRERRIPVAGWRRMPHQGARGLQGI